MVLREMMLGTRDRFDYFQCRACETIQIRDIPGYMGSYYPATYYSFAQSQEQLASPLERFARAVLFRAVIRPSYQGNGRWSDLLGSLELKSLSVEAVGRAKLPTTARVLEVGSGTGWLLEALEALGFRRLLGVDPFLPAEGHRGEVTLLKKDVSDLDPAEVFDLIILHHSLEHVPDPIGALGMVRRHLSIRGSAVVAMPIIGEAYRAYGTNWFQLDPPRHLHVFSVKGFEIALARSGLRLAGSYFNSTAAQFRVSEEYSRDIPLNRPGLPLVRPLSSLLTEGSYRARARILNRTGQGDQAVFYLRQNPQRNEAS